MEAEGDVILTGDAAIEALAKHLYEQLEQHDELSEILDDDHKIVYIEELISFIDQLVPAENLKLLDSWDLISEEAANAVAEVLLQVSSENDSMMLAFRCLGEDTEGPHATLLVESIEKCKPQSRDDKELEWEDPMEIRTESLDLIHMSSAQAIETQDAWDMFIDSFESAEAAGEAMHDAMIEAAPAISTFFKMPRAVAAMRLQEGIHQIINSLAEPQDVKNLVDILGFKHLELEVTVQRVEQIRDGLMELISNELGTNLTQGKATGLLHVFNYIGGALIYIRSQYAERVKLLSSSWVDANRDRDKNKQKEKEAKEKAKQEAKELKEKERLKADNGERDMEAIAEEEIHQARLQRRRKEKEQNVPKTFYDMFCFNAAVMDLLEDWMYEVLDCFDTIVLNAGNTFRLQEECDVLTLKIAKMPQEEVNLSDFKAVMLASLRSLIPKDWSSAHEAAWSWLWENVERLLTAELGRPAKHEKTLARFFASLEDRTREEISMTLYGKFFDLVPAGQEYFKQSASRLAVIANRVLDMSLELIKYPYRMVDELSALGLRHVGYNVPVEFFGPFVNACIDTLEGKASAEVLASFSWSIGLVSRMLVRTIKEGSTIVMKAVNQNCKDLLTSALDCAPRGMRDEWVLTISVGTQSISPLLWAIDSGTWAAAEFIIEDLLTIRADREKYYYGLDSLFQRHPDLVEILASRGTSLLPTLFNGMVWRSHLAHDGWRRANYYIKHLIVDKDGNFPESVENLVELHDPMIAVHPFLMRLADVIWIGVVRSKFVFGSTWLFVNFILFVLSHGMLNHTDEQVKLSARCAMFICRAIIYFLGMTNLIYGRVRHAYQAIRDQDLVILFDRIPIPKRYFDNWREPASLLLAISLIVSFFIEPIFYCLQHYHGDFEGSGLFTDACPEAAGIRDVYSVLSMFVIGLYMALLLDLATLWPKLSAYVLVVINVLPELFLMLASLSFFILMFATCIAVSVNDVASFQEFPMALLRLFQFAMRMNGDDELISISQSPVLSVALGLFLLVISVGCLSIFVAQLTGAYEEIYNSMVGYASLRRMQIEVDYLQTLRRKTWNHFVKSLKLEEPLEFGEGDIGLPGGIQIMEPAQLHPQHRESIHRYGGSTSSAMPWPKEHIPKELSEDERLEKMMKKFQKALATVARKTVKSSQLGSIMSGISMSSRSSRSSRSSNSHGEDSRSDTSSKSIA